MLMKVLHDRKRRYKAPGWRRGFSLSTGTSRRKCVHPLILALQSNCLLFQFPLSFSSFFGYVAVHGHTHEFSPVFTVKLLHAFVLHERIFRNDWRHTTKSGAVSIIFTCSAYELLLSRTCEILYLWMQKLDLH